MRDAPTLDTSLALEALIRSVAARGGLDLAGFLSAASYDAAAPEALRAERMLPGALSVAVLGNGGDALWRAMRAWLERDPAFVDAEPDPLDAWTARLTGRLLRVLGHRGVQARCVLPFGPEKALIPFPTLAELAGLGRRSALGLLIHPTFGTWVGLRAVLFLDAAVPPSPPLEGFDPCGPCSRPCAAACPAEAVRPSGGVEFGRCIPHLRGGGCPSACDARLACPVGREHAYPAEVVRYHHRRAFGLG